MRWHYCIFQSEIYEVIDAIFYDEAVTGKKNSKCYYNSVVIGVSTSSDGTTCSAKSDTYYGQYYFNQTNTTDRPLNIGLVIEFDVIDNKNANLTLQGDVASLSITLPNVGHYKIVVDEQYITAYRDGTQYRQVSTSNYITTSYDAIWSIKNIGNYITYKNFMIYPI